MRSLLLVATLVTLAACQPSWRVRRFVGPDGTQQWWAIECHGDASLCWRQAGVRCPHGYAITDRSRHDDVKGYAMTNAYGQTFAHARSVPNGELIIHCKEAPGRSSAVVVEGVTPAPSPPAPAPVTTAGGEQGGAPAALERTYPE